MKKWFIIFFFLLSLRAVAQEKIEITAEDYQNPTVDMADKMREEGKIYVLVGIIGIVFAGILVYVINTDRRAAKIEKILQDERK